MQIGNKIVGNKIVAACFLLREFAWEWFQTFS